MDFRRFAILSAAAAAVLPVLCHADSEDAALSACARAFAGKITIEGTTPAYKVSAPPKVSSVVSDYYAREFTFTMKAKGVKSGQPLGEATCLANAHGHVLELTFKAPEAEATLAAR